MTLSTLQSAESSLQPQTPTTAGTQEETSPKAQPQDDGELITISSATTTPTELSPEDPEASTEAPAMEGNPFEGHENGAVGSTFTPGEFDQPTGSGMLPPIAEEEGASPTASVGEPEETQSMAENEQQNKTTEPEGDDGRTERKKKHKQQNMYCNCYKSKDKLSCVCDCSSRQDFGEITPDNLMHFCSHATESTSVMLIMFLWRQYQYLHIALYKWFLLFGRPSVYPKE